MALSSNLTLAAVEAVYRDHDGPVSNQAMISAVAKATGIDAAQLKKKSPVGRAARPHALGERALRWHQQSLRMAGVIERVPGERGFWRITENAKQKLHIILPGKALLGFSTALGVGLWADCRTLFSNWSEPISLVCSSPPYPLRRARCYGGPHEQEYVDFICASLEPMLRCLKPGGTIALSLSNDIFEPRLPSRSLYLERLTLALHDRLGLSLMDRVVWANGSKPPGPVQWASKTRQQLNVGWEPILVFSNDPARFAGDNRRVLQPHTERHLQLIARGGERREAINSDGAYQIRTGSYGNFTAGRIPRNVLTMGHACASQQAYKRMARAAGLPAHGAPFPLQLASFFIQWLTEQGELVADLFAGSFTVGVAAELLNRRWVCTEQALEYVQGGSLRFQDIPTFSAADAADLSALMH